MNYKITINTTNEIYNFETENINLFNKHLNNRKPYLNTFYTNEELIIFKKHIISIRIKEI